jgi:hypothetical protein
LSEGDAGKIGRLIAALTEDRFRHQVSELVTRHADEMREIRRTGARRLDVGGDWTPGRYPDRVSE